MNEKSQGGSLPSRRIAEDLRAAIAAGELGEGQKLESERKLAECYGTARNTAREAVRLLAEQGLVDIQHGRGVFVRPRIPLKRIGVERYDKAKWRDGDEVAFIADRVASGRDYRRGDQTQTVDRVAAPSGAAEALGVPAGSEVYARARLVKEGDQPTHTLTSYYRPEHVEGTRLVDPVPGPAGRGGGFRVLYEAGYEIDHMREELFARIPTQDEVKELWLPPGEPVVELHRTTYTADGTVVEFAVGVHAASRFAWFYDFKVPDSVRDGKDGQ